MKDDDDVDADEPRAKLHHWVKRGTERRTQGSKRTEKRMEIEDDKDEKERRKRKGRG